MIVIHKNNTSFILGKIDAFQVVVDTRANRLGG